MSDTDIRHWDVGEKRTVTKTETQKLYAPDEYFGSDRDAGEIEVVDVELVEPELEGGFPDIEVTWRADVTKQLGPRWDERVGYMTDAERKRERRIQRFKRWTPIATTGVIMVLATAITSRMMNSLGGVTVNGEPLAVPTFAEMLPGVAFVFGLAVIIWYGLQGGSPGYVEAVR